MVECIKHVNYRIGQRDDTFLTGFGRCAGFVSDGECLSGKINISPFETLRFPFTDAGVCHECEDGSVFGIGCVKDACNFFFLETDGLMQDLFDFLIAMDGIVFDELAGSAPVVDGLECGEFVIDGDGFDALAETICNVVVETLFIKIFGKNLRVFIGDETFEMDDAVLIGGLAAGRKHGVFGFFKGIEKVAKGYSVEISFGLAPEIEPDFVRERVEDIFTERKVMFNLFNSNFHERTDFFSGGVVFCSGGTSAERGFEVVRDKIVVRIFFLINTSHIRVPDIQLLFSSLILSFVIYCKGKVCQVICSNPSFGNGFFLVYKRGLGIIRGIWTRRKGKNEESNGWNLPYCYSVFVQFWELVYFRDYLRLSVIKGE